MNGIGVGTAGYDHEQWDGEFYDSRLPTNWRFQYYANQFRAILLPSKDSGELLDGRKPELVEDSDDEFRFVLELSEAVDPLSLTNAPVELRRRIAGVVIRLDDAAGADVMQRAVGQYRELASEWRVCVDPGSATGDELQAVAAASLALRVPVIWRPEIDETPRWAGDLRIARLGDVALGQMRRVVERLVDGARDGVYAGVFFDDPATAPEKARECRLLAELMGH